tara:strand:- start:5726 stop:6622 length:897 start_codon:yes stop_codon:yes gene_type:complete
MALNYGTPGGFGSSRNESSSMSGPELSSPTSTTGSHGLTYGSPGGFGGSREKSKTPKTPRSKDDGDRRRREEAARREAARIEAIRQAAISSRNAAAKSKSDAINKAFTDKYTDDYYSGLRTAFNDEYLDDLQRAYDASMRGIWEGIRNTGVFDQAGFDTSKGKLDTARMSETADLDQLAMAYRDAQKKAVNDSRTGILAGLTSLYGGDNVSKSEADAQRSAINDYSYAAEMAKLRDTPDMGEAPEFFSGFNQAAARQAARTPTVRSGRSPQQEQQARGLARTMVRSPVGGGSSTVIRG